MWTGYTSGPLRILKSAGESKDLVSCDGRVIAHWQRDLHGELEMSASLVADNHVLDAVVLEDDSGVGYCALLALIRKKLRAVEKPIRPVEDRQERRAVGRVGDVDVAARPPHEIAGTAFALGVCT